MPVSDAYKGDVNTVPIPFGFAHNQYELLVAHPYHGKWQVRAALMAQWAILYLALIALIRVPARSRRTSRELIEADTD
ncbi:MAG TPA: hypothetical protein DDY88_06300 [Actinobacteria bacterium]|nr:hypothetical protein [Actinomycetota bacterium]